MKEIRTKSSIEGTVRVPGSKSLTHRALISAALAEGESLLKDFLSCEDTLYTLGALRELGIEISIEEESAIVSGRGGRFSPTTGKKEIFLGNSGTSYRFLLSTVALARGEYLLTGHPRMQERPIGDLVRALNSLGVEASCIEKENFPPVVIRAAGIHGGKVEIPGGLSSQFISSLLLAGPYAEKDLEIEIIGNLASRPYVDLTIDVMGRFGVEVHRDGYRSFRVAAGQSYQARRLPIEGDVSSASYFWGAAALTKGTVTTENIHPFSTRQGDLGLLDILEEMGCCVERETDRVTVRGGELSGVEVDMAAMPDMVPTLAALALFSKGKTSIRNVSHLRHKESDRLGAIAHEWSRLGGRVEEQTDGLIIHGGGRLSGTEVSAHGDHRIAMSLAIVGLQVPGLRIKGEDCVKKSFPRFWELWDQM